MTRFLILWWTGSTWQRVALQPGPHPISRFVGNLRPPRKAIVSVRLLAVSPRPQCPLYRVDPVTRTVRAV